MLPEGRLGVGGPEPSGWGSLSHFTILPTPLAGLRGGARRAEGGLCIVGAVAADTLR